MAMVFAYGDTGVNGSILAAGIVLYMLRTHQFARGEIAKGH